MLSCLIMKKKFDFNFKRSKEEHEAFMSKPSRKEFRDKIPYENTDSAPLTTIYVGNLNYRLNEDDIKALFTPYGYVKSVSIVLRQGTDLKSGIAFVKMTNKDKALKAINELNGKVINERTLKVSIANSRF